MPSIRIFCTEQTPVFGPSNLRRFEALNTCRFAAPKVPLAIISPQPYRANGPFFALSGQLRKALVQRGAARRTSVPVRPGGRNHYGQSRKDHPSRLSRAIPRVGRRTRSGWDRIERKEPPISPTAPKFVAVHRRPLCDPDWGQQHRYNGYLASL